MNGPTNSGTEREALNAQLSALEKRVLNEFQHGFPLTPTPYADMAAILGVSKDEVIAELARLKQAGAVSRVGAVLRPNSVGASTLAAMAVPPARLEAVAALVNGYAGVNHNYERENELNLWFVATAPDTGRLQVLLDDIAARSGIEVLAFPLVEDYHIDLGFELWKG